ncbi:hypothetical protein [Thalassotalea fusca]
MRELSINEVQEVNGGVVFLIPPAVTFAVKVTGVSVGVIGSSVSIMAAYKSLMGR